MLLFGLSALEQELLPARAPALEDSLILRVAQGDTQAFSELYLRVHKAVYGFALSIVKNQHDAEDVMQDTFLKVDAAAGSYQSKGKPMAWVLTIARNLALEKLRERRDVPLEQEEDWHLWASVDPTRAHEDKLALEAAMKCLGNEERQVVTLHAMSGLKHREIAALLNMPLATVLSKYRRALLKLKDYLEEREAT